MISLSTNRRDLASAFGVHRALDAAGAVLGPLAAFFLFWYLPGSFDLMFLISFCIAMLGVGVILLFVDGAPAEASKPQLAVRWRRATGPLPSPDSGDCS